MSIQFSLLLDTVCHNQYLFSDHYLANLLPQDPRWTAVSQQLQVASSFLLWLKTLYAKEQNHLPHYNETKLEEHWFKPILAQLGHVFEGQAAVPGLGKGVKKPDYLFFPDETRRQTAVSAQKTADYTTHALAVGEVKAWAVPLGKKLKEGGPSFDAQNPSQQIHYYLQSTSLEWGILSNGRSWRLIHHDSSGRLDTYYELDLLRLLERNNPAEAAYFSLFFQQAAFRPDEHGRIFLADALAASRSYALELEEDLQQNAYSALEQLVQGFLDLPANQLSAADLPAIYDNSLYLLYRLLFIFYAESRALLPLGKAAYRHHYSLQNLKADVANGRVSTSAYTTILWSRLGTLFQIINGDNAALNRDLGVPRYNGGLFNPAEHPFLAHKAVGDRALAAAIDLLSRRQTAKGQEFVDYRTLRERQLGSIYEGLLEYRPLVATVPMVTVRQGKIEQWLPAAGAPTRANVMDKREAGQVYLVTDKGERKASGSYYTPGYIVAYIVENTLGPLVAEVTARVQARGRKASTAAEKKHVAQSLAEEILNLKVLDPAMGSGHFLVAATHYLAEVLATDPHVQRDAVGQVDNLPHDAEEDVVYWRRRVVERCIYGLDKNPLAVELAKLSLWLATVAADQPLSFLDHHLKCGDSLIGARVADLGWPPPAVLTAKALKQVAQQKAGQLNLFQYRLSQLLPAVMGKVLEIVGRESDSYETVQAKEAADTAVQQLKAPFEAVANLWTTAFFGHAFTPAEYDEAVDALATERLWSLPAIQTAQTIAAQRRFFHWELAFPDVFYDQNGQPLNGGVGFDAVIGNPPYVFITAVPPQERDYFFATFSSCYYRFDVFGLFIEQGIVRAKPGGNFGYIIPHSLLNNNSFEQLRRLIIEKAQHIQIIDFTDRVFADASNEPMLLLLHLKSDNSIDQTLESALIAPGELAQVQKQLESFPASLVSHLPGNPFVVRGNGWLKKLVGSQQCQPLGEFVLATQGLRTGDNSRFLTNKPTNKLHRKILAGSDIDRYMYHWPGTHVLYDRTELDAPRKELFWTAPQKILVQEVRNVHLLRRIVACLDSEGFIGLNTTNALVLKAEAKISLSFVMALLSSNLINEYFRVCFVDNHIATQYLEGIPLRSIAFTTPIEERQKLAQKGQKLYEQFCEKDDAADMLGFVAHHLGQTPQQADVVHDLLAFLAEQMITLHQQKQQLTADFWLDLEGITETATFAALRRKGKQESSLSAVAACRPFISASSHSSRTLDDSLAWDEEAFKGFTKLLANKVSGLSQLVKVFQQYHEPYKAVVGKIGRTDQLIDQVVYQLYGLTAEEIVMVEAKGR